MSDYAVVDPATGETIKKYPTITDADLEAAIGRADAAHREWGRSTTVEERAALVRRVGELHDERRQHGSPRSSSARWASRSSRRSARSTSARRSTSTTPTTRRSCWPTSRSTLLDGDGSAFVRRSSLGLLLGIMPWNYPYYQVARFAGPNLVDRQHDPAQARAAVPGVGGGDGADLPRGRLPDGRLHQHLRDQRPDRGRDRRPARAGRLADRLRPRRRGRRRDRRAQPQEGRARARRLGPVHRARAPTTSTRSSRRPSARAWRTPARRATRPSASSWSTSSTSRSWRSSRRR